MGNDFDARSEEIHIWRDHNGFAFVPCSDVRMATKPHGSWGLGLHGDREGKISCCMNMIEW